MPKKTTRVGSEELPAGVALASAAESKLENFAEDLGRLLGTTQGKAENWLGQRKQIAAQLVQIRDTATDLLSQLTGSDAKPAVAASNGKSAAARRRVGRRRKPGPKKRTMSPEARAKISAAQRARWAKQKRAAKG
jgi:hypothetical protein